MEAGMRIIDGFDGIYGIYSENGSFDMNKWRSYADSLCFGLSEKCEKDCRESYDLDKQVLPVLNKAYLDKEKLDKAHESFLAATSGIEDRFFNGLGMNIDVDIILYLGLCSGAGWATDINGKRCVLLGIEKIVELGWQNIDTLSALIYHELGHIWHFILNKELEDSDSIVTTREKAIAQLYEEGIAMLVEQILMDKGEYYHQYDKNWLGWCEKNEAMLAKEYLRRIIENDSVQDFFGDWCSFMGHSDTGYFLGCRFIRHMLESYSLKEIATMDIELVSQNFARYARRL